MASNFDPALRQKLSVTSDHPVILNGAFSQWNGLIERDFAARRSYNYTAEEENTLLPAVSAHIAAKGRIGSWPNILLLVHPFYTQLINMNEVMRDRVKEEIAQYTDTLLALLKRRPRNPQLGVVVHDTAHLYAATSSLLLEQGLVDHAILTTYDSGRPYCNADLDFLRGKNIYIVGGYNGRCIEGTAVSLRHVDPCGVFGIRELILEAPYHNRSSLHIDPDHVPGINPSKILSLAYFTRDVYDIKDDNPQRKSIWRGEMSSPEVLVTA